MKTERTVGTKPVCVADFGTEATVEFYQESERGYSEIESMKRTWHFFVQTLPPPVSRRGALLTLGMNARAHLLHGIIVYASCMHRSCIVYASGGGTLVSGGGP